LLLVVITETVLHFIPIHQVAPPCFGGVVL